jgi:CRISPR-associated endonuclease/helicase Cas3
LISLNPQLLTTAPYFARSDPDGRRHDDPSARWQLLASHLSGVARIARELAQAAAPDEARFHELAFWAGLAHDLGKYTAAFQGRLHAASRGETAQRVEHSAHGAALLLKSAPEAAFAIAGHHAGLPAPQGSARGLRERATRVAEEAKTLWGRAREDFARHALSFPNALLAPVPLRVGHDTELGVRMLASVLVDGDRTDAGGQPSALRTLHDARVRLERLLAWVDARAASIQNEVVRRARREVLDACLSAARSEARIFSLTVPTGGGKTLSATAFALERAALGIARTRRLVYVVPYLSIIEQNADILATAIGADAVLEHHSGELIDERQGTGEAAAIRSGFEQDAWLARENWNAPVVVTTSVRFFETLFSNHPGNLRRLHALAGATVILDEVQTLPRGMVGPILTMLRNLTERWSMTVVFSTATQPAFEREIRSAPDDPRFEIGKVQEICSSSMDLFGRLRRVKMTWPGAPAAPHTWAQVAQRIGSEPQILCIVNTTRHARELFGRVADHAGREDLHHLSARMCPLHRLDVLARVRLALAEGRPCRLIATQVVEAGVDIDFPVVLRALGPLDSIAQAAGRCDREGLRTAAAGAPAGEVVVFEPDDEEGASGPPGDYRQATNITRRRAELADLSLDEPSHMRGYFQELYGDGRAALDAEDIDRFRAGFDFPKVAEKFRIIDDSGATIVVPFDEQVERALRRVEGARQWLAEHRRTLQRASISIHRGEFQMVKQAGAVYELFEGSGLWVAVKGSYRDDVGFIGHIEGPLIA